MTAGTPPRSTVNWNSWRADADAAAQHTQALENQLEADHIPDPETIGRLRGAIVNLETVRKSAAKARADKDESMKALLRAEKAVSEFPFSGQTAEDARQEASVPPKVSFNAAPSLVVFFLMLAIAAGITMYTISRSLLTGWEKVLPWGIFAAILAAAGILSRQMQKRAIKRAQSAALVKRFGTADPSRDRPHWLSPIFMRWRFVMPLRRTPTPNPPFPKPCTPP